MVELPCVVTSVARQIKRSDNSEWGKITVEDFTGTATILAFRDAWESNKEILQQDAVVLITGRVSDRADEEDPPIFLNSVRMLEEIPPLPNNTQRLLDVLTTRNRAGLHGATSGLTEQQRADLVQYLLQIE